MCSGNLKPVSRFRESNFLYLCVSIANLQDKQQQKNPTKAICHTLQAAHLDLNPPFDWGFDKYFIWHFLKITENIYKQNRWTMFRTLHSQMSVAGVLWIEREGKIEKGYRQNMNLLFFCRALPTPWWITSTKVQELIHFLTRFLNFLEDGIFNLSGLQWILSWVQ